MMIRSLGCAENPKPKKPVGARPDARKSIKETSLPRTWKFFEELLHTNIFVLS
jgi:hypothetical protein